jgi:ABC-2 type transport system ATP-binding protein
MTAILEVRNLVKKYATHTALDDVSITVPNGSIYGLLGPNGAGKTSLIRIITQITAPDNGCVLFDGKPLSESHTNQIGYLPEERGLYKKMEVGEQLLFFAGLRGMNKADARKSLQQWLDRLEMGAWWHKKIEELSKGMQQKVQFIATVLHHPSLIILDEPFSGFDPINADMITQEILRLQQYGATIIFSTHRMETVEQLCDHIALINRSKKILEGPIEDIRNQYKTKTYEVLHHTVIDKLNTGSLIETQQEGTKFLSIISINQGHEPNDLISELIGKTYIHRFEECIPDMQQVFVKAVLEANNKNT